MKFALEILDKRLSNRASIEYQPNKYVFEVRESSENSGNSLIRDSILLPQRSRSDWLIILCSIWQFENLANLV